MPEAAIVTAGMRILKRRGAWGTNNHGTTHTRRGTPDWHGAYRTRAIVIEFKRPGGRLTRLQEHELRNARRAGAEVCVARSAQDIEEFLDAIDKDVTNGRR